MRRLGLLILCILAVAQPWPASAAYERTVFQYTHQRWSDESDAPRPVFAIAQDHRGYLWIATATGVYRFDGIRFEKISAGVDLLVHGPPSALLVRRNGDVWINFERSRRFAVYRAGQLRFLNAPAAPHRVADMEETSDGTIWVLTEKIGAPLMRYRDEQWTTYGFDEGAPFDNPYSMVVTRDGDVWVSFTAVVMRLQMRGKRLNLMRRTPGGLGRLSLDPQGRVWISERAGSYPMTGPDGRGDPPPLRHAYATDPAQVRGWPKFDREGNLWIATYYDGLQRVAQPDPRGAATKAEAVAQVDHYTARDGLSSNATSQIFQDAEGNVWAATDNGLDRFWPASLRFDSVLTQPAAFGDLLLRASDGSVYIGEASTVYRVAAGKPREPIFRTRPQPRSLCEAPDGAIWIGTDDDKVAIWRAGKITRLPGVVPVSDTIYDCAFDASGAYWVTAGLGGIVRYKDGRWKHVGGQTGEAFVPKSMISDPAGTIFIQWNDRTLSKLDEAARHDVPIPFGTYQPFDVALYAAAPDTVLVGGRFGLARYRNGRFRTISPHHAPLFSDVSGVVQSSDGQTWLAGPGGVVRVATDDLARAFDDPGRPLDMRLFAAADGLKSRPHDHSRRSIVQGGDGRLWVATQSGTLWIDPNDISSSRRAPLVSVSSLSADRIYRDPTRVRLPAGTSNIQIDFAALRFSNARAVRVRYRIEGQDDSWIDPGPRRQAFYTNLAPGTYHFEVVAATDEGNWTGTPAIVEIEIPPTFLQSRLFLLLCGLLALVLAWALMRWRYVQVTERMRSRLEERVKERERIARDLHDTLLQGVQGLVFHFQAIADRMPRNDADRSLLQSALDQADEVIFEGRERVRTLRGREKAVDLPSIIQDLVAASPFDPSVGVSIEMEGRPRPVDPFVAAEIFFIGSEALFNIKRHAQATQVDIVVDFDRNHLRIRFLDNGRGIPADVLVKGRRDDHYGIVGMLERTERLGGSFSIGNRAEGGAEIMISLSAKLAYADAERDGVFERLYRWFARFQWREP